MSVLQRQVKIKLYALYSNDTTGFKTLIGDMYYIKPPAEVTQSNYPIVVYQIVTTSSEYDFYRNSIPSTESVLIEFKILSASTVSTEAENILEKLQGVYDGASLTLTGWGVREMSREPRNSITGPYVDDSGIWNLNALYRLVCDKE